MELTLRNLLASQRGGLVTAHHLPPPPPPLRVAGRGPAAGPRPPAVRTETQHVSRAEENSRIVLRTDFFYSRASLWVSFCLFSPDVCVEVFLQ